MLKELPMLEELHLEHMHVSKQAIEVAGLKSFKLNYDGYRRLYAGLGDQNALPIAENLRGLRHLQLIGNKITIDGLLAIIENCPHLESLDIWNCFNVANQLGSDLRKRLSQQIKDLRLPLCSTKDY
ncbi:Leucine-rich repeat, cysteine-containing subtype [Heracleum sosnowskyi]|uniref:Leucine-rich repeat, cysteine-containing subtype n=1 Tax=Heracleum sosnowskyi TaxID=360622 RepID=A0AAD8IT81_9APIA|nr:Leucine-rich repeat, cysteine-containing subtype [Heracleum sosnowskyi]